MAFDSRNAVRQNLTIYISVIFLFDNVRFGTRFTDLIFVDVPFNRSAVLRYSYKTSSTRSPNKVLTNRDLDVSINQ